MKNVNTTTYVVASTNGVDSGFMACLLIWTLEQAIYDIRMSAVGSVNQTLDDWLTKNTNFKSITPTTPEDFNSLNIVDLYLNLDVTPDSNRDFVVVTGQIDQEILDNLNLAQNNIKVLVITHEESDARKLVINQFFKMFIGMPLNSSNYFYQTYLDIKDKNDKIINKNITKWRDLTNAELTEIFNAVPVDQLLAGSPLERERFDRVWVDDADKNNLFELTLDDMLTNKNAVMDVITKITNKPVTETVNRNYDRYINIQAQQFAKYLGE